MTLAFPSNFFSQLADLKTLLRPSLAFAPVLSIFRRSGSCSGGAFDSHIEMVHSTEMAERSEASTTATADGPTILVVDDEVVVRDVAVKMLNRNGFRAIQAGDGAEALRVFEDRRSEISAVLMDLVMPVMSGEEAFRAIREIDASIPVIFSSGYSAKVVRARCGLMRPDGFLQKPYHDSQLLEVLRQAF